MFLTLTRTETNKRIRIAVAHIIAYQLSTAPETDTIMDLSSDEVLFVKETPEEIDKMLTEGSIFVKINNNFLKES